MNAPPTLCAACGLRRSGPFCALEGALLRKLDAEKSVRVYRKGQGIFYEGAPPLAGHCLQSGRVKLYKVGESGEEHVIRLLGPGEAFGFRALLANEPFSATAEATEDSTVCTIPREALMDLVRRSPGLAVELLAKLARELRTSEEMMVEFQEKRVRQRAAHLLLALLDEGGGTAAPGAELTLTVRRKDLARLIGTTPETLSRTFRYLVDRGILGPERGEIHIRDVSALRRVAGGTRPR